jgi:hypothetical protein
MPPQCPKGKVRRRNPEDLKEVNKRVRSPKDESTMPKGKSAPRNPEDLKNKKEDLHKKLPVEL